MENYFFLMSFNYKNFDNKINIYNIYFSLNYLLIFFYRIINK